MGFIFCPPDCPKRTAGCHSNCDEFKRKKAEYERLKAISNKEKEARAYAANMNRIKKDRIAKRKHLKNR